MIQQEGAFAPGGTAQTITTDEAEFANAFYEAASRAGLDVELQILEGAPRLKHRLTFLCADEEFMSSLYQAAYALCDAWAWREMPGVEDAMDSAA